MKREGPILVAHRLLDEQILDCDGRRCGRVDDIELRGNPPQITALLVGKALYPRRLPQRLRGLARRLAGPERWGGKRHAGPVGGGRRDQRRDPFAGKAAELGLGEGDRPEKWMVERLPWN